MARKDVASMIGRWAIVLLVAAGMLPASGAPKGKNPGAAKSKPQASVLKVKPGNYTPGGKLTRREFVEKTFGVKFGAEIDQYVKPGDSFDDEIGVLTKKLSAPVCGLKDALLFASDGKLDRIQLVPQSPAKREAGLKATKARLAKFDKTVGKWLGVKSFETKESMEGEREGSKAWRISSVFGEDGLNLETAVECTENGKTAMGFGCSLTISFSAPEEEEKTDAEAASTPTAKPTPPTVKTAPAEQPTPQPQVDPEAEEAKAVEARMKKMIFPRICFMPPATIIDAVDYFRACAKELDDHKLPPEQRGFDFAVNFKPGVIPSMKSRIEEHNISLWDALGKLCADCDCKFAVRGKMVCVMSKTMTVDPLVTRSIPFTDEMKAVLDQKAGAAAIHDKVCAGDEAAYAEMYAKYKAWFESQGVECELESGNRRTEFAYVRAIEKLRVTNTEENLAKIEKLLQSLKP